MLSVRGGGRHNNFRRFCRFLFIKYVHGFSYDSLILEFYKSGSVKGTLWEHSFALSCAVESFKIPKPPETRAGSGFALPSPHEPNKNFLNTTITYQSPTLRLTLFVLALAAHFQVETRPGPLQGRITTHLNNKDQRTVCFHNDIDGLVLLLFLGY